MYNLHCHSLLSDGCLLPSELAVRFQAAGYKVLAITDHADYSNIDGVIKGVSNFLRYWPKNSGIQILSGIELTHIPLSHYKPLVRKARRAGIKIIIGHGETTSEPITAGTNAAALEAGVDILAHPGRITKEDALTASRKRIFLEITARAGHRTSNAYVASQARKYGANLVLNLDSHAPEDIIFPDELEDIGLSAGLSCQEIRSAYKTLETFLRKKGVR